jgi:hypothetical protein
MDVLIAMKREDRRTVFEQAANTLGLAAASIEKDLWVCWTLRELFGLAGWDPVRYTI